ncbi:hypothetical protein LCGC14_2572730, partial [marine sediment metagenome]
IQGVAVVVAGEYALRFGSANNAGGACRVEVLLNAGVEAEEYLGANNDAVASAENIDPYFLDLGGDGQRAAVLGVVDHNTSEPITSADFETGQLSPQWETYRDEVNADIDVTDIQGAAEGDYALIMWGYRWNPALLEATWTVDLTGQDDAVLEFAYADIGQRMGYNAFQGDFTGHVQADGVAISDDGVNWHPIWSIPAGTDGLWRTQRLDLAGEAARAGMTLGDDFKIKFQVYGLSRSYLGNEWQGWDAITIRHRQADTYAFTLQAGDVATVATRRRDEGFSYLALLDESGQVVATGTHQAHNMHAAILDFVAPADGTYHAQVTGGAEAQYMLLVTRNASLSMEPHDAFDDAQDITPTGVALGVIGFDLGRLYASDWSTDPPEIVELDPATGEVVNSGTLADIHTDSTDRVVTPDVTGSFRELVLFVQDTNPRTEVGAGTGRASVLMKLLQPHRRVVATDINGEVCEIIAGFARA